MSKDKINVAILIRSLNLCVGGVQIMATKIANELSNRNYNITIITWDNELEKFFPDSFYKISSKVEIVNLNIGTIQTKSNLVTTFKRIYKLRKYLLQRNISTILAFVEGTFWNALLATIFTNISVVASERASPDRFNYLRNGKYKFLIMNIFRFAEKITVQFDQYINSYPKYLRKKIISIPNAIESPKLSNDIILNKKNIILCVARDSYEKNIEVLIRAFGMIDNNLNWKLILCTTEGADKKFNSLINQLNISKKIKFISPRKDLSDLYLESAIFCLPSYFEGFPNTMAEAMSYGNACIGFEDCLGIAYLINSNRNGLLAKGVNNPITLSQAMEKLMKNKKLLRQLAINSKNYTEHFQPNIIYEQWDQLLRSINN